MTRQLSVLMRSHIVLFMHFSLIIQWMHFHVLELPY